MTLKEQRKANVSKWSVLAQEAESSSLTIKEWCKTNRIWETTFYYWKKQVKAGESTVPIPPRQAGHPAPCFIEVDVCTEKETSSANDYADSFKREPPEFLIWIHNCQIAVNRDF